VQTRDHDVGAAFARPQDVEIGPGADDMAIWSGCLTSRQHRDSTAADGGTKTLHPLPESPQDRDLLLMHHALVVRADIQQQIAAATDRGAEHADDVIAVSAHRLQGIPTPAAGQRLATFPISGIAGFRDLALMDAEVGLNAAAVIDDQVGPQLPQVGDEPRVASEVAAIEPQQRGIIAQQQLIERWAW